MGIQPYRALLEAGVKEETASSVVDSLERDITQRMSEARKELATKADLAEAKTDIIKWNLATVIAVVGVMLALMKAF
jgi:hypothetical protein